MFDLDDARHSASVMAKVNTAGLSDAALCEAVAELATLRRYVDATEAHVLVELADRGTTDRAFGLQTGSWVARRSGVSVGSARVRVTVAQKLLTHFPVIDAALTEGRISWERAKVICDAANPRIIDALAELQQRLLDLSRGATFRRFARDVEMLAGLLDADGGYDPDDDPDASRCTIGRTPEGGAQLTGTWFGAPAHTITSTIDRVTDELFARITAEARDHPDLVVPPRPVLRAMALEEICRRASATDISSSRPPVPEVHLVVPAGPAGEPASADSSTAPTGVGGVSLADGTLRLLDCDAHIRALIIDDLGQPLDVGRSRRLITPTIRAAMWARDGGCVFPGCDAPPAWCDGHHLHHWCDGGTTSLGNCHTLCRRHHGVIHRTGWSMTLDADGWPTIESPSGRIVRAQRHGRVPPDP